MRLFIVFLAFTISIVYGVFHGRNKFNKLREADDEDDSIHLLASNQSELWFTQILDHFIFNSTETWKQRYYLNEDYYKEGGPEFLMIGGEGPVRGARTFDEQYPIVDYARRLNARIWNLEHRFYGKSHPKPDQSVENLQLLTSRQALEDLANFIQTQNTEKNIQNPKWVVFGGSYPGALALWFRSLYPDLTVGAVGSSAPIDIQMDFYGYLRVCQDAFRSQSPKCAENIGKAFDHLHRMMDFKKGRNRLQSTLNVDPEFEKQNLTFAELQTFYLNSFEMFQGAVQYSRVNSGKYATGYSVPDVCKIMEEPVFSPITHLIRVAKYLVGDVFNNDYDGDIEFLKREDFHERSASRSWTWQTCNEFGYFQSTGFEKNIFGVGTPVNYYLKICSDVYGEKYDANYVVDALRKTQEFYGEAEDYNATNVVIPNGSIDPWHALGTYVNGTGQYSYLIEGSAHCAEMSPPSANDVPGLGHIRKVIFEKLQEWISDGEAKEEDKTDPRSESAVKGKKEQFKHVYHEPGKVCFGCGSRSEDSGLNKTSPITEEDDEEPKLSNIDQIFDHFEEDKEKQKTFKQYFYLNEEHYEEGGPILLLIGGEGPLDYYKQFIYDSNSTILSYAKQLKAALYGLEHRFYGKSLPTNDLSLANLQFLTSRQALADLNFFIETINNDKKYVNPKWVAIGGSYPGFLAAQLRVFYPKATVGTVGSSGPMEMQVDNLEFNQVVERALDGCKHKIREGFDYINHLMGSVEGRELINQRIGPCKNGKRFEGEDVDPFDKMEFYRDLTIKFTDTIQYAVYGPNDTGTIGNICSIWNDDRHDIFSKFNSIRDPCYEMDYDKRIKSMADISVENPGAKSRCWWWQTCNEFGNYPSTDGGDFLGSGMPINYFMEWCRRAYDPTLTRDKIEDNIKRTKKLYGGAKDYQASKHLHIYGDVDPWYAQGFFTDGENHGEDVVSVVVEGMSHMGDLFPEREIEPEGLKAARKLTVDTIRRWTS